MVDSRRIFLFAMVTVGACTAVLVGACLVFGPTGDNLTEFAISSSLMISYCLLMAMGAYLPYEKKRFRPLAFLALCLCAAGVFIFPSVFAYLELFQPSRRGNYYIERIVVQSATTYAISLAYTCFIALILMPRMNGNKKAVQIGTILILSATFVIVMIETWAEPSSDVISKIMSLGFIACAAGALIVFAIAKFSTTKSIEQQQEVTRFITLQCPRCLITQPLPVGASRCAHCKLKFNIEMEEPRCGKCGYVLHGLTIPICPECGTAFSTAELAQAESAPKIAVSTP